MTTQPMPIPPPPAAGAPVPPPPAMAAAPAAPIPQAPPAPPAPAPQAQAAPAPAPDSETASVFLPDLPIYNAATQDIPEPVILPVGTHRLQLRGTAELKENKKGQDEGKSPYFWIDLPVSPVDMPDAEGFTHMLAIPGPEDQTRVQNRKARDVRDFLRASGFDPTGLTVRQCIERIMQIAPERPVFTATVKHEEWAGGNQPRISRVILAG